MSSLGARPTTRGLRARPTTRLERSLFDGGAEVVAGIDEVGRGAWAGPLSVGIALVGRAELAKIPLGVRDSKLLTPGERAALFDPIRRAVRAYAVGHVSPAECDDLGMTAAEALAARRAFDALARRPDVTIVDGVVDFVDDGRTVVLPKADRRTRLVAAASVLAKVTRDALMVELARHHHAYGFERNKGYASSEHRRAVARHGLSAEHRASWNVRTFDAEAD